MSWSENFEFILWEAVTDPYYSETNVNLGILLGLRELAIECGGWYQHNGKTLKFIRTAQWCQRFAEWQKSKDSDKEA